jgi:hypothetical protein
MKLASVPARGMPSPLLLLLLACGPSDRLPDADHLPYDLVRLRHVWNATSGDLDGDGEDEIINWYAPGQMVPGDFMAVVLRRHTGAPIDQVNFDGLVSEPLLRDLDSDGAPEILVPLIRNDSLFLSVLDREGTKLRTFYMTSGRPRIEPEGAIPWDPTLVNAFVADVDGVAGNELVTVIVTGYARLPRGVFVHALPDGRPIDEMIVGAGLTEAVLDDFDGDGRPELVVVSSAGNNGADAGGFDDSKAYLLFFELTPDVRVVRSLELPVGWGYGRLGHGDFDGDGRQELLVTTALHASSGGRANFRILDAATWQLLRERDFDQPLASPILVDLDHDTRPEIVTLHAQGELWVFDHRLEVTRTRALPGAPAWLTTAPDVDADGLDELIVRYDPQRALLLDRDLAPRATWDGGGIDAVVRRGFGEAPLVIVQTQNGDFVSRLDANPTYLVNRYAPAATAILAGAVALVFTLTLLRFQRENRRLRAANAVAPIARVPACLVDARGRVRWTSPALRLLLPAATGRRGARRAPAKAPANRWPTTPTGGSRSSPRSSAIAAILTG